MHINMTDERADDFKSCSNSEQRLFIIVLNVWKSDRNIKECRTLQAHIEYCATIKSAKISLSLVK